MLISMYDSLRYANDLLNLKPSCIWMRWLNFIAIKPVGLILSITATRLLFLLIRVYWVVIFCVLSA